MQRVKRLTIRAFQPHQYTYDNIIYLCERVWVCGYIQRRRSFLKVYNTIICIVKIIISKSFFSVKLFHLCRELCEKYFCGFHLSIQHTHDKS